MNSFRALALGLLGWFVPGGALLAADPGNANGAASTSAAHPPRVVIIGDSITAGHGLDPDEAYPAVLQKDADAAAIPAVIVNAGVSGDTTAGGLRRLNWALNQGADVVIIALGGNDGLRGVTPEQTAENLGKMIDQTHAKLPAARIIIAGMQMPPSMGADFAEKFAAVFPKVAAEKHAELVPSLLAGVGGDPKLNQEDRIHPTAEGQKIVAGNVWKILEGVLKSPSAPAAQ